MSLNMSWKNFRSIHGEEGSRSKFENLMYDLLCREYPSDKVHKTDSSRGGDGGVDIFVERDGGIDIYQCKFFPDKMENTQWKQIQTSFENSMKTAEKEGVKVLKWCLCTPFISNREPVEPWKRWNTFVDANNGRIEDSMVWIDGASIIQKLENPALEDLQFKYFMSGEGGIQTSVSWLEADIDFQQAKSVRRLSAHLSVSWKTRWLYDDRLTAATTKSTNGASSENAGNAAYASDGNVPGGQPLVRLTPTQLRLLSVLVQGEGAVVSWDELYRRGIVMQRELDEALGLREESADQNEPNDNIRHILKEPFARREIEQNSDEEPEIKIRIVTAITELCAAAPALLNIIKPAENGAGYYISQSGTALKNTDSGFFSRKKKVVQKDWQKLYSNGKDYSNTGVWLRRYYTEICNNFETRISNSGNSSESEEEVFGRYKMVQAYANAFAKEDGSDKTQAMLDYVEKWYYGIQSDKDRVRYSMPEDETDDNRYGRVLILHGQPGDGKTTFCKKAVYAHCFEGWLKDVPQVLRISLNPNDSNREIVLGGELNLPRAMCIVNSAGNGRTYYYCDPMDLEEGALIIFDGYDELSGELLHVENASTFRKFYERVKEFAKDSYCNIVITSRTMCIEQELKQDRYENVAQFAPMTPDQQDALIDRMIELDGGSERSDLKAYKEKLSKLRKKPRLNELMEIPSLFRMVVRRRFTDEKDAETPAELYSHLFHSLMSLRNREDIKSLLGEYEKMAAGVFNYNDDTCPYGKEGEDWPFAQEPDEKSRELIYLFLTKNGPGEIGQLGFLHRAFYQFFLARYIVTQLLDVKYKDANGRLRGVDESGKTPAMRFIRLFLSLRASRITDPDMWQMMTDIVRMRGAGKRDVFSETTVKIENIKSVLECFDDEKIYAKALMEDIESREGSKAEYSSLPAAENAFFNLMGSLTAMEKGCLAAADSLAKKEELTCSHDTYTNICELLRRGHYAKINFEGQNLAGCKLQGAHLEEARMSGGYLRGADLSEACLAGADLTRAKLNGAKLARANLFGAQLKEVSLKDAVLERADLRGVDLTGAHLENAHLEGVDLQNANLTEARLSGAFLTGANLKGACLKNAWLDGAHVEWAHFEAAVLTDAHLDGAHLERCHMEGAVLVGTDFSNATLNGAYMQGAYLDGTRKDENGIWKGTAHGGAILTGSNLKGAGLEGAFLSEEQYRYARKSGALGLLPEIPDGKRLLPPETFQDKRLSGVVKMQNQRSIDIRSQDRMIPFGNYYRQGTEKEPLFWRVLRREYDKVLMITEELVDCQVYNKKYEDITWEQGYLRKWMNEDFMHEAFTEKEQREIAVVCNQNPDNRKHGTKGGNPTWDRIFALSTDEAEKYFRNDMDRRAAVTPYAKRQGGFVSSSNTTPDGQPTGWWWLRSPGDSSNIASIVGSGGGVYSVGYDVNYKFISVRPALWLNL